MVRLAPSNDMLRSKLRSLKKNEFVWRFVSNLRSTTSYVAKSGKRLSPAERKVLRQLNRDGISISSVDSFLTAPQIDNLYCKVAELLEAKESDTAKLKVGANDDSAIGSKTFNLELLGSELTFKGQDQFSNLALQQSFLNIANSYFHMIAKLRYYNVWYTAASSSRSRESQLWHFDREDHLILKVFLYLDDVDEGTGPFTYAPETHKKGKYRSINPEFFLEGNVRRSTDEQMRAVFPEDRWIKAVGKKGTIIFADTRGFHKGGEARTNDRIMFTCMFTSPASESKRLIVFPRDSDLSALTHQQRQALQYK